MNSAVNNKGKEKRAEEIIRRKGHAKRTAGQPELCQGCSLNLFPENSGSDFHTACNPARERYDATQFTLSEEERMELKQRIFHTLNLPYPTETTD